MQFPLCSSIKSLPTDADSGASMSDRATAVTSALGPSFPTKTVQPIDHASITKEAILASKTTTTNNAATEAQEQVLPLSNPLKGSNLPAMLTMLSLTGISIASRQLGWRRSKEPNPSDALSWFSLLQFLPSDRTDKDLALHINKDVEACMQEDMGEHVTKGPPRRQNCTQRVAAPPLPTSNAPSPM
ncbi:unnamed protein product [Cylindrotheca closterium]|uniref:Uncharacterized protein n=1 Tax=Cylindrotheca closterium TaxID=2856 RepID=A0AAD2FHZ5_9STRA|nr:unnamed protein product [Cylindrotheca closterium]